MKRFSQIFFALLLTVAFAASSYALPALRVSSQFLPADSTRTAMDVGGVWNGTADASATTGDAFVLTLTNDGDETAFDLTASVTLPNGFHYVAGTAQVQGSVVPLPTLSAVQTGNQLTFTLAAAGGANLPAGASLSIRYGLVADSTVSSGSPQLTYYYSYALAAGGAPVAPVALQQNVLVIGGDSVLQVSAQYGERAVGEVEVFTVTVRNTSRGGLFDVAINESQINPGNHLQFIAPMVQLSPARSASLNGAGDVMTITYLAPGEEFSVQVSARVLSCGNIVNVVTTTDRVGRTAATSELPVKLDLRQPLIQYDTPQIRLSYKDPVPVSIQFNNTRLGAAEDFVLHTTLPSLPVTVSNVAAGWNYDAASGTFTLLANDGRIENSSSRVLTFDIQASDICSSSGEGVVFYETNYTNTCGDQYFIPQKVGSVLPAEDTPTLSLTKSVNADRIAVKQGGTYTLRLAATNIENIATAEIVVTDILPEEIELLSHNAAVGTVSISGEVLTWRLPRTALTQPRELTLEFAVRADPCLAGNLVTNRADVSVQTVRDCTISLTSQTQFFVSNNPELVANQFFHVANPSTGSGFFETGSQSADLTRDRGEGEFIPFEAYYDFSVGYPGTWVGSTYSDDFGLVPGQTLVPGSLTYTFDNGTSVSGPLPVPAGAVSQTASGFRIDLSFLNTSVEGTKLRLNYRTTIPDSALDGGQTRRVLQRTNLVVAEGGSGNGICNESAQNRFTQGVFYSVGRAAATLGFSNMPSELELCKEETLRINVGNLSNGLDVFNPQVTLLNAGTQYEVVAGQTPVFGGVFAGNMTYSYNGGTNPTFTYTGGEMTGDGWIDIRVVRSTGSTSATGFSARVNYDSRETEEAAARVYTTTTSYAPLVVHQATLALTVTPGTLNVVGTTVEYTVYLTNTNAGTAFNSILRNTLPQGASINTAATNAKNTVPVEVSGQDLVWELGDINSGQMVAVTIVANIDDSNCTIELGGERIVASWGCNNSTVTLPGVMPPVFFFPQGKMQVIHDSTQSVARLCDIGRIAIIVRNTGPTDILDAVLEEIIPSGSGIEISGPVQYRINGGALQTALGEPERSGDRYIWRAAQIPALALLSPQGSGGTQEVRIEFDIVADSSLELLTSAPVLNASATARIACGNPVVSPAQPFSIPIERPRVNVSKVGRNVTANASANFTEVVYGGRGDVVEWRVTLHNTGESVAKYLRISDPLSQSNPTGVTVSGPGLAGNVAYVPGDWVEVSDLLPGQSAEYVFTETLGGICVNGPRTARATWGCASAAPNTPSPVSTPGNSSDAATLIMDPVITQSAEILQTVTQLSNGRARIDVIVRNSGGNAIDLKVTGTLSSGMVYDNSVAPVLVPSANGNASIGGVTVEAGNLSAPVFTFTGPQAYTLLRYGEEVRLRYYVRPNVFDTNYAQDFPALAGVETTANGLDPSVPASVTSNVRVDYENSCGSLFHDSNSLTFPLLLPDLDITAVGPETTGNNLLSSTTTRDYTFEVTNNGPSGSLAERITLDFPDLGPGWAVESISLTNYGSGGSGGTASVDGTSGAYTFTPAQVGSLASGQRLLVTARLTYNEESSVGSLRLLLRARGAIVGQDGSENYGNYSYDQRAQRVLGVSIAKTLVGTSEDGSSGTNVFVGEEVTWLLTAKFRGGEAPVENLVIRDQMRRGQSTGTNHDNFGYVSHVLTTNHTLGTPSLTATNNALSAPPVSSGRLEFNIGTVTPAQMAAGTVFETELTGRVMNVDSNGDNQSRTNRAGMMFRYLGATFRANNTALEFATSNTVARNELHASHAVWVYRPQIQLVREARNITQNPGGPFLSAAAGQAGDVIEYRVTVSNPASGTRPLYSLVIEDTVHPKMSLLATGAGADTDANNAVDVDNADGVDAGSGKIIFDESNTVIPIAGRSLARLDAGRSVVLLYRVRMEQSVNPSETITSVVTASGQSIPAPHGGQSVNQGEPDAADGALVLSASVSTPVITIDDIEHGKAVTHFSAQPADDNLVYIGEQIRYQIRIEIPQGTVPDFVVIDRLPASLALLETPAVTIGSGISGSGVQPAITPAALPADGGSAPLEIRWDFGARVAQIDSSSAERTVTIEYVAQVRNIESNRSGLLITNEAAYSFTGLPQDIVNLDRHTLTIAEPAVTLSKSVDPQAPVQAGHVLTYTVTVDNSAGTAPAYDLSLVDTLPAGVTYVANSTSGLPEPEVTGNAVDGWVLTWGRTHSTPQTHHIAAGATVQFTYQVTVDDTSHPEQVYTNSIRADWTSLEGSPGPSLGITPGTPGSALGERTGTSEPHNHYVGTASITLNANNSTGIAKSASGQTLPLNADGTASDSPSAFRIGDLVTYTLRIQVQEATLREFRVLDALPAGLVFVAIDSILPASGSEGFTYAAPAAGITAPDEGASGELVWDFGTMINAGDGNPANDEITLVYTARIVDAAANPLPGTADLKRENSARVRFLKADDSVHTTAEAKVEITVSQPVLALEKTLISPAPENILRPDESGKFRLRVINSGTAPAYNVVLDDIIPQGMRGTAPVLTRADLNGVSILTDLQTAGLPTWDSGSGKLALDLSDAQFINAGSELVLEYTFAIDTDAIKGETLVNKATVHTYFGKPSGDALHRREYNTPLTASAPVIVGLEIRGFVYNDIEPNGQRDGFEDWSAGTPVFVNLVNVATGVVYRSTEVLPGDGGYVLTRLPRGDYRIIVTDTPTRTTAVAPASWLFRMPQSGERSQTLTVSDRLEQNFGLYQGLGISGIVFRDTGESGGTANDGQRSGGEIGLPSVTLRLLGGAGMTQLGQTQTDGNGQFVLYVPDSVAAGTVLVVEQVNLPQYRSTGGHAGTSGGAYDRSSDRITFTFNGGAVTGLQFGDVPQSSFTGDGAQTIESGAAAYYRHTFVAGTSGTVVFEAVAAATPALSWAQAIILDSNCNGQIDGEPTINGQPISVVAGQEICLIVREQSPSGVPYGAQDRLQVRAQFTYDNASPALAEVLVCTDLTTIGSAGAAGLQLEKTVDKVTARPGEVLTYTIVYTNTGSEPISDLFIDDRTPHYTTFVDAEYAVPPANLSPAVLLTQPAAGATGSIRWTFDGTLAPGASGQVSFRVQVLP